MSSPRGTILLLGGTGKISSQTAPLLHAASYPVLLASRSGGNHSSTAATAGIASCKFDWFDPSTYSAPFQHSPDIKAVFLVAPPVVDCFDVMKGFVDLAREKGVKRFVLLSASPIARGDEATGLGRVGTYLEGLEGIEWAVLKPTWFMENFVTFKLQEIKEGDNIITATGEGKIPFVSARDVAAVAAKALTDAKAHNTEHIILGPELLSYDDVADIFSKSLGRKITHVKLSAKEFADHLVAMGIPADYAAMLMQMENEIKGGAEDRLNDVTETVTGKKPLGLREYVDVNKGVWAK